MKNRFLSIFGLSVFIVMSAIHMTSQVAALPVQYCVQGGTQALTSGLKSTNYQQGIVPSCTVTVYLTGTSTLATLYADGISTPLSNPFTASSSGKWLAFAAVNQGYDVVLSGGILPNIYTSPVTLTGLYPGTNIAATNAFGCTGGSGSINCSGNLTAASVTINDPSGDGNPGSILGYSGSGPNPSWLIDPLEGGEFMFTAPNATQLMIGLANPISKAWYAQSEYLGMLDSGTPGSDSYVLQAEGILDDSGNDSNSDAALVSCSAGECLERIQIDITGNVGLGGSSMEGGGDTDAADLFVDAGVGAVEKYNFTAPSFTITGGTPLTSQSSANSQIVTCATGGTSTQYCGADGAWHAASSGGLSGMTATQIPIAATATTVTSSVPAPSGTIVGTTDTQTLTNKTVDGVSPTTMGYVDPTSSIQTQLNGKQATITTLPVANGGTGTGSTLTGLVRGSASAMTAAELSGDATTSGSNAVTVVKVNGGAVPASSNLIGTNSSSQPVAANATSVSNVLVGTGGGTANAQTVTLSPAITTYATTNGGVAVTWKPSVANTAAATINVSGVGVVNITKCGATALVSGDLTTTAIAYAEYDGTEFQLLNPQVGGCSGPSWDGSAFNTYGAWTLFTSGAHAGLNLSNTNGVYFTGSTYTYITVDTNVSRIGPGVLGVGYASSDPLLGTSAGSLMANGGVGVLLKSTAAITGPVPVKADTSNANQVVVTTTSDTGAGIVLGICTNSPAIGGNCYVITSGIAALTLGTGTCAIGNQVIVDTTTNGMIKCTATVTVGDVIGIAMSAQSSVGSTVNVFVRPN